MTAATRHQTDARVKSRTRAPDLILYAAMLFVWLSVWRVQDLWPPLAKLKLPTLLTVVLIVAFVADSSPVRKVKWAQSQLFYMPFVLLGIMVLGVPFGLYPGLGLTFLEKDFVPTVLLVLVISTSMREQYDLEWAAFWHMIGAILYSGWTYLHIGMGRDGRLGNGLYYDPNDFALLLVCTIPFAIYFLKPGIAVWKRIIAAFGLALFAMMLVKTGSRGGFLGLVTVALYVVFRFRAIPVRLRIGAVALGTIMLLTFASSTYWGLIRSITHPEKDYNATDDVGRKAIWKRGVGYMVSRPVLGVGVLAFGIAEGKLSAISKEYANSGRGLKWSTAHNSFVLIGAELGVGGLVAFVFMILLGIRVLASVRAPPDGPAWVTPEDTAFAQMLTASLLGYSVSGFFISASYFTYLYLLIGLTVGQQAVLRRRAAHARVPVAATTAVSTQQRPARAQARKPQTRHWAPTG